MTVRVVDWGTGVTRTLWMFWRVVMTTKTVEGWLWSPLLSLLLLLLSLLWLLLSLPPLWLLLLLLSLELELGDVVIAVELL